MVQPPPAVLKRLIRVREMATILDVSKTKAYNMVASGQVPSIRMDGTVRVPLDDLLEWIKRNTTGGK